MLRFPFLSLRVESYKAKDQRDPYNVEQYGKRIYEPHFKELKVCRIYHMIAFLLRKCSLRVFLQKIHAQYMEPKASRMVIRTVINNMLVESSASEAVNVLICRKLRAMWKSVCKAADRGET